LKKIKVLAGIYPIAQLQEPYNAIRYLAEHISMIDLLNIRHPSQTNPNEEKETTWSPLDICEGKVRFSQTILVYMIIHLLLKQ
jgi:hypothetical protein